MMNKDKLHIHSAFRFPKINFRFDLRHKIDSSDDCIRQLGLCAYFALQRRPYNGRV